LRDLEEISRELNFSLDFGADTEESEGETDADNPSTLTEPETSDESEIVAAPSGGGHE
jgi:hypothetical protein